MRMQLTQALAAFLIGETRKCRKLCSSSQSGKSCSTSRKDLKNCVSEAPSPRGAAPNRVPLLRRVSAFENSSWQRTNLRSCNIDMLLTEKYLTQLSRASAVRSSSIFFAATLRCFGRMIVLHRHKATCKKGRLSVRKTSPED